MKHIAKRALSLLLSLIMAISVFAIAPVASAADETSGGGSIEVSVKALYMSQKIEWTESSATASASDYSVTYDSSGTSTALSGTVNSYVYDGVTHFWVLDETTDLRTYTVTKTSDSTVYGTAAATHTPGLGQLLLNAAYSSFTDTQSADGSFTFTGSSFYTIANSSTNPELYAKLSSLTQGAVISDYTLSTNVSGATTGTFPTVFSAPRSGDVYNCFRFGPYAAGTLRMQSNSSLKGQYAFSNVGTANVENKVIVSGKYSTSAANLIASANGSSNGWYGNNNGGWFLYNAAGFYIGGLGGTYSGTYFNGTIHYLVISEEDLVSGTDGVSQTYMNAYTGTYDYAAAKAAYDEAFADQNADIITAEDLQVSSLYKSHKVEWSANLHAPLSYFTLTRNIANGDDTTTEEITLSSSNTTVCEYDGKYYYTALVDVGTDCEAGDTYTLNYGSNTLTSSAVTQKTGAEALLGNAVFNYDQRANGGLTLDGTEVDANVTGLQLAKLKSLSNHTFITRTTIDSFTPCAAFMSFSTTFGHDSGFWYGIGATGTNNRRTVLGSAFKGGAGDINDNTTLTDVLMIENNQYSTYANGSAIVWPTNNSVTQGCTANLSNNSASITGVYLGKNIVGTLYYALVSEETYTASEIADISALLSFNNLSAARPGLNSHIVSWEADCGDVGSFVLKHSDAEEEVDAEITKTDTVGKCLYKATVTTTGETEGADLEEVSYDVYYKTTADSESETNTPKEILLGTAVVRGLDTFNVSNFSASALYKSQKIEWYCDEEEPASLFTLTKSTGTGDGATAETVDLSAVTTVLLSTTTDETTGTTTSKYLYSLLVSTATGTGEGTVYTLTYTTDTQKYLTATVADNTGIEALKNNALVAANFGNDGMYFDGTGDSAYDVITHQAQQNPAYTAEELLGRVQSLHTGSLILAFCPEDLSTANQEVLGLGNSKSIGTSYTNYSNLIRTQLPTLTLRGSEITDLGPVAMGVSSSPDTPQWSYGESSSYQGGNGANGSFNLLDSTVTTLTLGSNTMGSGYNCFKGAVYYLIVSEEYYTAAELEAITNPVTVTDSLNTSVTPDPIRTTYNQKIADKASVQTAVQELYNKLYQTQYVNSTDATTSVNGILTDNEATLASAADINILRDSSASISDLLTAINSITMPTARELTATPTSEDTSSLRQITDYDTLKANATASSNCNTLYSNEPLYAFDGKSSTWVGAYGLDEESYVQTGFNSVKSIGAIGYTAAAENMQTIGEYEIWVSNDEDFSTYAVAAFGTFAASADEQLVVFENPVDCQYIRLVSKNLLRSNGSTYQFSGAKEVAIYEYVGAAQSVSVVVKDANGNVISTDAAAEANSRFADETDEQKTEDVIASALAGAFDEVADKYNSIAFNYTVDTANISVDSDGNVTVPMTQTAAKYTVTANYNGESDVQTKEYNANFEITAPDSNTEGNSFSYWKRTDDGLNSKIADSKAFNYVATTNMTIEAVYEETPDTTVSAYIPAPIYSVITLTEDEATTSYNIVEVPVSFFNVVDADGNTSSQVTDFGMVIAQNGVTEESIKNYISGTDNSANVFKSSAYSSSKSLTNKGRYLHRFRFASSVTASTLYAYIVVDGEVYLSNAQTLNALEAPAAPAE